MKSSIRWLLLLIPVVSIALLACGGGGSASGGIGGTGIQARSVGSVSAVGSITVNGVRFQTTTALVRDDEGGTFPEVDLAEGMVVEVEGVINNDGVNGTASQVTLVTAVQGPVDQILNANRITVMGQPVAIDDLTIIDGTIVGLGGITALTSSNTVEIHGTVDPNGAVRATRIEDKTGTTALFKIRGLVAAASPPTFTINGLTIDFSNTAQNDFGSSGPTVGDFVSVRGSALNAATLTADVVENESRFYGENVNAEIEGFIINAVGSAYTLVTGAGTFQFRIDATTEFEGGVVGDLVVGLEVEVEGTFNGGSLLADEIEIKDGVRLENSADITSRDIDNLTIRPDNMSALVLKLNDQTEIKDNRTGFPENPTPAQLLGSLDGSETLRARGRISNTTVTNATELAVTDLTISEGTPSTVELRGPLAAPPDLNGVLQIFGVAVYSATASRFLSEDESAITETEFLSQVTTGTVVEAEGSMATDNSMNASQLAIENE